MTNTKTIIFFLFIQTMMVGLCAQHAEWNLDFEIWDIQDSTPDLWFDTIVENRVGLFPPNWHFRPDHIPERTGLGQTTDATTGEFAVALSGFYQYQVMRIISGDHPVHSGWPIDFKPNSLIGDYKAILLGSNCDSLRTYIDVFLTRYELLDARRDTVGTGSITLNETSTEYVEFEVDIDYRDNSEQPDTIIIVLAKERFGFDSPPECLECSHVYFDNLRLNRTTSVLPADRDVRDFDIFPNPTNREVLVQSRCNRCKQTIQIIDLNGQVLYQKRMLESNQTIDMRDLENGIYFVRILDVKTGRSETQKIMKR